MYSLSPLPCPKRDRVILIHFNIRSAKLASPCKLAMLVVECKYTPRGEGLSTKEGRNPCSEMSRSE